MAKRKRKKTEKEKSARAALVAVVLAILFILAFQAVRYFRDTPGEIVLLDLGISGKFTDVQRDLGHMVVGVLKSRGVRGEDIDIRKESGDEERGIYVIRALVPDDASLIKFNSAIDAGVESVGGSIRSCVEGGSGDRIEMEIGTRRVTTHRCLIIKSRKVTESAPRGPAVAIVIDDFGFFNNRLVRDFMGMEIDLTISVIPGLKHSSEICAMATAAGKDVICHMPMEPENGSGDYGDISIVEVSMDEGAIEDMVEKALEATPCAVGMNNHMGSKATADRRVMRAVLKVCRRKGVFFLDSLTSPSSVAAETAVEMGMPRLVNDIFLDNRGSDIRANMSKLMEIASRRGRALGIMHVKRESFESLMWMKEEAKKRGIRFTTVREMSAFTGLS